MDKQSRVLPQTSDPTLRGAQESVSQAPQEAFLPPGLTVSAWKVTGTHDVLLASRVCPLLVARPSGLSAVLPQPPGHLAEERMGHPSCPDPAKSQASCPVPPSGLGAWGSASRGCSLALITEVVVVRGHVDSTLCPSRALFSAVLHRHLIVEETEAQRGERLWEVLQSQVGGEAPAPVLHPCRRLGAGPEPGAAWGSLPSRPARRRQLCHGVSDGGPSLLAWHRA